MQAALAQVAPELTYAEFYTNRRRISGAVDTGRHRLSELLNNTLHSYLPVRDMSVLRLDGSRPDYASAPDGSAGFVQGLLRKASVQCVVIVAEPPRPARLHLYVAKTPVPVWLALPWTEVTGTLHLSGTNDPFAYLRERSEEFLPVSNARLTVLQGLPDPIEASAVIVNRAAIEAFCIAGEWAPWNPRG
jgi:hypothetical protein